MAASILEKQFDQRHMFCGDNWYYSLRQNVQT